MTEDNVKSLTGEGVVYEPSGPSADQQMRIRAYELALMNKPDITEWATTDLVKQAKVIHKFIKG